MTGENIWKFLEIKRNVEVKALRQELQELLDCFSTKNTDRKHLSDLADKFGAAQMKFDAEEQLELRIEPAIIVFLKPNREEVHMPASEVIEMYRNPCPNNRRVDAVNAAFEEMKDQGLVPGHDQEPDKRINEHPAAPAQEI